MTDLLLQWRAPAPPYGPAPATIVGPPGPRPGERVQEFATGASITPNAGLFDLVDINALDQGISIVNPVGVPVNAQRLMFRIKDDGASHPLTWGASYQASASVALPPNSFAGKLMHLGFIYYSATAKWMLIASTVEA